MSWFRVPPEAAEKSLPRVSLNCVVLFCVYLEGVLKFVYHVSGLPLGGALALLETQMPSLEILQRTQLSTFAPHQFYAFCTILCFLYMYMYVPKGILYI